MIGLQIDLELADGSKHLLDITWGVAYRWQQSHPNTTIIKAFEENRVDEMLDVAWEAAKTHGLNPKPMHQWVDEIREVKFVSPKASTN